MHFYLVTDGSSLKIASNETYYGMAPTYGELSYINYTVQAPSSCFEIELTGKNSTFIITKTTQNHFLPLKNLTFQTNSSEPFRYTFNCNSELAGEGI